MLDVQRDDEDSGDAAIVSPDRYCNAGADPCAMLGVARTDGGRALAPLPGEQRIRASCGTLTTTNWIGRAPAEVELELRPTFTVGGTVSWDHAATPALDAKISCSSMRGTDREELASTFVRADGTYGALRLPIVACDSYVVELEGASITHQYVDLVDPQAGEHRSVAFTAQPGSVLTLRVLDPDALAVSGANVSAQWMEGPTWRRLDRRTNSVATDSHATVPVPTITEVP